MRRIKSVTPNLGGNSAEMAETEANVLVQQMRPPDWPLLQVTAPIG